jgi:hypothetical protein
MRIEFLQSLILILLIGLAGCTLPQVIKPMNLYDINDGTTIELYLNPTSWEHGTISSSSNANQKFHGECNFFAERGYPRPGIGLNSYEKSKEANIPPPKDFGEAYGFTKDTQAKPVGTGIVVSDKGTVIELVFYHYSTDIRNGELQTADGIGRDNNGRYYRIFLSTQSQ